MTIIINYYNKVREEEINWGQRSRCSWLKDGDKNTKFFHRMAFARMRTNIISFLIEDESKLESRETIIRHIKDLFVRLYTKEDWNRPHLDNLAFTALREESVTWLERELDEDEVRAVVFDLGGDKAPGSVGFSIIFYQQFWMVIKANITALMQEFHSRSKTSKKTQEQPLLLLF